MTDELERQRRIVQAIKALPAQEREVFCKVYGGVSAKQIAKEVGIPRKSVYIALNNARRSLARWLDDLDIEF